MGGIHGIGGVPDPNKPDRPANVRDRNETAPPANAQAQDDVTISSEAQAAAQITGLIQTASAQSDVRADRVEAAKQNLAQGTYREPEVVAQVAERLSKLLDL